MHQRFAGITSFAIYLSCALLAGLLLFFMTATDATSSPLGRVNALLLPLHQPSAESTTVELPVSIRLSGAVEEAMAPFVVHEIVGDFDLQIIESAETSRLRILSSDSDPRPGQFELTWVLPISAAEIDAGTIVTASMEIRLYSPAARAALRHQAGRPRHALGGLQR